MMMVWAKMIVKLCSDSGSILKLESIGFAYGLLVARIDPKQLELL